MRTNIDHLLIDARNLLYRAAHSSVGDYKFNQLGHNVFSLIVKFINDYLNMFNPKSAHLFWDPQSSSIWRRDILPTYKEGRVINRNAVDIRGILDQQTELCIKILPYMGLINYFQERMEADDLIYAFCRLNREKSITIVSSDKDFRQIPYTYENIQLYNPLAKIVVDRDPGYDPVIMKCLIGDKSDNIDGYYGIGEKRALPLCNNIKELNEFFTSPKACIMEDGNKIVVGDSKFRQNMSIIDLSLCPYLVDNMMYVGKKQTVKPKLDMDEVRALITKHKVRGLLADIPNYITSFRRLVETQ